jgi:probable rRNA maturation factor
MTVIINRVEIDIELNDKAKSGLMESFLLEVARKTFEEGRFPFLVEKELNISVAVVGDEEIKGLNKSYRNHDESTDILSFSEYNDIKEICETGDKDIYLGELILCYNDIKKHSKNEKLDLTRELAEVVSHGILHLLGFQHGDEMFGIQKSVAQNFKK